MRVRVLFEVADTHQARLREVLPSITFGAAEGEVDVLVAGYPSESDLDALRPGGVFVLPFSGLPPGVRDQLRRRDVVVYNLHHNAAHVAEHAVGLVLALARRLIPIDGEMRRGDWRGRLPPDRGVGLNGQRAVVIGHGAIGGRVAFALRALGMTVVCVRASAVPSEPDVVPVGQLDEVLVGARVVVVAVPHTAQTEGLLDARRIALLGPDTVVVNVARGGVIAEQALFEALRDGRLHGAGLDVWWRMPEEAEMASTMPSTLPFHTLDNVVLSPHRAAHAVDTEDLRTEHLVALLSALADGREPGTRVDLDRGY